MRSNDDASMGLLATKGRRMKIHISKPLFAWECLEDSPTIETIRQLLEAIPDQDLIASLEAARGKGRDDYPIRRRPAVAKNIATTTGT